MKLLLVDDDLELTDLLTFAFGRGGFDVLPAHDAPAALRLLREHKPDVAVVDVNLGGTSGFDLLEALRRESAIPVVMLTARDAEGDKVLGLELGADDYVTKPFSHRELLARVRAQLRRHGRESAEAGPAPAELSVGPLTLFLREHRAELDHLPLSLSVTEFRLLSYLAQHAGVVVRGRALLEHVWGSGDAGSVELVRVAVHRLRRKLGEDAAHPRLLHTVAGVGIMLKANRDELVSYGRIDTPQARE
ncbi:MAG: response regulator transcription factor [Chloroflexota bacterium]